MVPLVNLILNKKLQAVVCICYMKSYFFVFFYRVARGSSLVDHFLSAIIRYWLYYVGVNLFCPRLVLFDTFCESFK